MKLTILLLIIISITLTWAKPRGGRGRGGKKNNGKRREIKEKLGTMTCEEKASFLDAKLDMDFDRMQQMLGIEVKHKSQHKIYKKREKMAAIKEKVAGKSCQEKEVILTAMMEKDRDKLKELGIVMSINKQLKQNIKAKTAGMPCEQKEQILVAFLDMDKARLSQLLGDEIELPLPKKERKQRKRQRKMAKIKEKIEGKTCEENSIIMDAILDSDKDKLKELGIKKGKRKRGKGKRGKGKNGKRRGNRRKGRKGNGERQDDSLSI